MGISIIQRLFSIFLTGFMFPIYFLYFIYIKKCITFIIFKAMSLNTSQSFHLESNIYGQQNRDEKLLITCEKQILRHIFGPVKDGSI